MSVPLYWIDNLREDQPDWLKNHLRGGVLGVVDCQKSEIDLDAESASLPFLIHYSTELGVWTEKNPEYRKESSFGESDDYWF